MEKPVYKMSQKEVAANLKDVTHISLSDNGYSEWDTTKQLTQNYELTILYAAKAKDTPVLEDGSEGNGWQYDRWERADGAGLDNSQPLWEKQPNTRDNGGTADMDKYSFNDMEMTVGSDGATKEIKGLVYYDTLTELEKAGHTCVAVLYQIRNCCVRTGRSVEIGHMMEVTKDVSKIGRSYALTMDVRGWTTYRPFYRSATATGSNPGWTRLMDNGTVLTKRSELLYQGLIEGTGKQADPPVSHTLTSAKNSKINWDIGTPTIPLQRQGLSGQCALQCLAGSKHAPDPAGCLGVRSDILPQTGSPQLPQPGSHPDTAPDPGAGRGEYPRHPRHRAVASA